MPGFVKLLTAADIPQGGKNSFIPTKVDIYHEEVHLLFINFHCKYLPNIVIFCQVFADKTSHYAGQSVALVIAGDVVQVVASLHIYMMNYTTIDYLKC